MYVYLLGIGKALVAELYSYDAIVFAVAKNPERLAALKQEFPKVETRAVDLEDWEATRAVIVEIGPVHFLVNNAAVIEVDDFLNIRPESFDKYVLHDFIIYWGYSVQINGCA